MFRSLFFISALLISVSAEKVIESSVTKLATFDGASSTTYKWKDLNDPVMGGVSTSTWTIDKIKSKSAMWNGEVKNVPSLKAPGFCNAETVNWFAKFADVSAFTHLLIRARSSTPEYRGFKVSFAADTLNVQFHSFKAMFNITQANTWETVAIPFHQFSNDWSAYTGRCDTKDPTGKQHHCCSPEHPEVCVTKKNLKDISEIGLWTEGVAGKFNLEVAWIGAGNMSSAFGDSRNTCSGPVQTDLKYNVSGRLADDYLPSGALPSESLAEAVCCDKYFKPFAEPSGFYARPDVQLFEHMNVGKTTIFYDSICGLPLFEAPRNRTFAEFKAETNKYGWPSFRKDEIVGNNVKILASGELVSACGTHLGSNQPDALGDRFCTDLVCLSGHKKEADTVAKSADELTIFTFDGAKGTTYPWEAVNDPVMGGQSNSTITIDLRAGLGMWNGEVKIVPFLKSPGFCTMQSPGLRKKTNFPSVEGFSGIVVTARASNSKLKNFQISFRTNGAVHGEKEGQYTAPFTLESDSTEFVERFVPWADFECNWRGEKVSWCPDIKTQLSEINNVGIMTAFPGQVGTFHVEIKSISARK